MTSSMTPIAPRRPFLGGVAAAVVASLASSSTAPRADVDPSSSRRTRLPPSEDGRRRTQDDDVFDDDDRFLPKNFNATRLLEDRFGGRLFPARVRADGMGQRPRRGRRTTRRRRRRRRVVRSVDELPPSVASGHKSFEDRSAVGDVYGGLLSSASSSDDANPRRHLASSPYEPIRIKFDTSNAIEFSSSYPRQIAAIVEYVLPSIESVVSSSLSVVRNDKPLYVPPGICGAGVTVPSSYSELREGYVEVYDLVVFVKPEHCGKPEHLAYAFPCQLHPDTDRPVAGVVTFCVGTDLLTPDAESGLIRRDDLTELTDVAIHEFLHVLGFNRLLYPYYRDHDLNPRTDRPLKRIETECVDGSTSMQFVPSASTMKRGVLSRGGSIYYEIVTPTVAQVARNQFDCRTMDGARLENQPTNAFDCFGSHWDERLFFTESMSAIFNEASTVLSALTLALMEDTGWYRASYASSSVSTFGLGAGCDFVEKDCIINGRIPPHSDGFFCNKQLVRTKVDEDKLAGYPLCDVSHTHIAECDLVNHSALEGTRSSPPPEEYAYFPDKNFGPIVVNEADYCPIPHIRSVDCRNPSTPAELPNEVFGPDSLCFNAQFPSVFEGRKFPFSICLKTECNEADNVLEVFVGDAKFVCSSDGQIHTFPGGDGGDKFKCPRFAVACPHLVCPHNCAGRGVCNFDLDRPRCECFDADDPTAGCTRTAIDAFRGGTSGPGGDDAAAAPSSPSTPSQSPVGGGGTPPAAAVPSGDAIVIPWGTGGGGGGGPSDVPGGGGGGSPGTAPGGGGVVGPRPAVPGGGVEIDYSRWGPGGTPAGGFDFSSPQTFPTSQGTPVDIGPIDPEDAAATFPTETYASSEADDGETSDSDGPSPSRGGGGGGPDVSEATSRARIGVRGFVVAWTAAAAVSLYLRCLT